MPVSKYDEFNGYFQVIDIFNNFRRLVAGVYHHAFTAISISYDITVGTHHSDG
jgi:hypothetical protein